MTFTDRIVERLRSEHLTTLLGVVTIAVVIITLALAALYGPDILNSTTAVETGTQIQGCRSSYAAEVTDRRTEFDIARSKRDNVDAELDVLTNEITDEAIFGSDERVLMLREGLPDLRRRVLEANQAVGQAEAALTEANNVYQLAVNLSLRNPVRFLAQCEDQ